MKFMTDQNGIGCHRPGYTRIMASRTGIAVGLNRGHAVTSIPRASKPSDRKGVSYRSILFPSIKVRLRLFLLMVSY